MKNKLKRVALVLLAAALVALTVISSGCSKEEKKVVFNCYDGNYVSAVSQVIKHEKLMEKYLPEGYTVEYTSLVSGPEVRDALLAGSVNIADISLMTYQTALDNSLPLTLISFTGYTPINLYTNKAEYNAITDFKAGDQITVTNRSTNLHAAYLAAVQEMGLDIHTYDQMLIASPNTESLALLSGGATVAGSIFSFPTYSKTEEMSNVHMICDFNDVIQEYSIGSSYVCTDEYYKKNKDVLDAFRKAQDEALAMFANEPERVSELLAGLYNLDKAVVEEAIKIMPPTKSIDGYNKLAELLVKLEILKNTPKKFEELYNYKDIIDFTK